MCSFYSLSATTSNILAKLAPKSSMIDTIREMIENPEESRPLHLYDMDAAGEQENCDNETILESLDTTKLPDEDPEPKNVQSSGDGLKNV